MTSKQEKLLFEHGRRGIKTMIHEPYELSLMNLKELNAKIIEMDNKVTCTIQNPEYKYKVKPAITNTRDRLKIIMKYRLYKHLLKIKKIRYCPCGNLIMDSRPYVDICDDCLKGIVRKQPCEE